MLIATGEVRAGEILPTDWESLIGGIVNQNDLQLVRLDRVPAGFQITVAATPAIGSNSDRFNRAATSAFTAVQGILGGTVIGVPTTYDAQAAQDETLPTLEEYVLEAQPWFPQSQVTAEEIAAAGLAQLKESVEVVLLTATEVELSAALSLMTPMPGRNALVRLNAPKATYYVGRFGAVCTALGLSSMGSVGRDASITTTTRAIAMWRPKALVMMGIAFGLKPGKQQYGDVLVSDKITPYEPQRKGVVTVRRGQPASPGKTLLARFRAAAGWVFERPDGSHCKKHVGEVLSGEKLVDDKTFRDELVQLFPDAIGGEMEGAGLYAAAADGDVEWIIVKGICDWGYGKHPSHQELAAAAAGSLVMHVLKDSTVLHGLERPRVEPDQAAPPSIRLSGEPEQVATLSIEVKRERDLRVLRRLLQNLPLRFIDLFIEDAQMDRIPQDVFFFWEGFNVEATARDFHVFDDELRNTIVAFHQAWGRALSHGEYFITTLNPNMYRYRNRLPGEPREYEANYRRYHEDVTAMEQALDAFVEQIKSRFEEVDLFATSKEAWEPFVEWKKEFKASRKPADSVPTSRQSRRRHKRGSAPSRRVATVKPRAKK